MRGRAVWLWAEGDIWGFSSATLTKSSMAAPKTTVNYEASSPQKSRNQEHDPWACLPRRTLLDPGVPGGPGRRSTLGAACENSLQYDLIPGSLARRVGPKQRAADAKVMVECVLPSESEAAQSTLSLFLSGRVSVGHQ